LINGSKTEILAEKIDWIAYSLKSTEGWAFCDEIDQRWKDISPLRNFTHAQENRQGIRRYWNTITASQGRYVVCSGGVCTSSDFPISEYLHSISQSNAKPTRIDFCLDIMQSDFKPQSCVSHLRAGNVVTHARSIPKVSDDWKGGFTQYVGTKSSDTYTRIYDKQAEAHTDFKWTRIETVYQGQRAEFALSAYQIHKSCVRLIRAHVDFPKWKAWSRVMQGNKEKFNYPQRIAATRKWLLSQVSKSLAKELAADESHEFLFEFMDAVRDNYREIVGVDEIIDW
jgi:hypothetical protein